MATCTENPAVAFRYQAEKMLFQADKECQELRDQSGRLSALDYGRLLETYQKTVDFSFAALDSVDAAAYPTEHIELKYIAHKASWQLARLQQNAGQFDGSIETLNRLMTDIQQDESQLLQTCLLLSHTLQAAGRWDSAKAVYNFTIAEFYPPLDNMGEVIAPALDLPAHLYRVISAIGDAGATSKEFARAEQYYRKLVEDYPATKLAMAAHLALADLYDHTRQWQKEVTELSAIADPDLPDYKNHALRMADVLGGRLGRFDTARVIYDNLLTGLNPEDSALKPDVNFKIALLMMEQKQYEQARSAIFDLKEEYPRFFDSTPMPQYTLARSLELEGNWKRAETEYSLLIQKYGGTDEAMMAHLHVLEHLRQTGRELEAKAWYQSAENHFDDAANRGRGTPVEAKALFYKAELRRRSGEYSQAAEILISVFNRFPTTEPGRRALVAAADLYRKTLNDPAKADSLLNQMRRYLSNIPEGVQNKDLSTD